MEDMDLPPLQSSPCHDILSSGQRAKAFRQLDLQVESTLPTWLSRWIQDDTGNSKKNSAFWTIIFVKVIIKHTQFHQIKKEHPSEVNVVKINFTISFLASSYDGLVIL